jgi:hypothetical protein
VLMCNAPQQVIRASRDSTVCGVLPIPLFLGLGIEGGAWAVRCKRATLRNACKMSISVRFDRQGNCWL